MKKTKELIEKQWEAKLKSKLNQMEITYKKLFMDLKTRLKKSNDYAYEKLERKKQLAIKRKTQEYERKCKNEIRQLQGKEIKIKKISPTKNKLLQFALDISQENAKLRDTNKDGTCKCISCGKIKTWKELAGGHFYSRTIQGICLWMENINAQCHTCNRTTGPRGNVVEKEKTQQTYRKNIIKKFGEERIQEMEQHMQKWYANPGKYSPTGIFLLDYIPDLIDENEKLWKTKSFTSPKRSWRNYWNKYLAPKQ